jgi:lipoate-protein ligase A
MAMDESLMGSARQGGIILRFYQWEPGCLSFGRNQTARGRYDGQAAARRGIDVVRRPTGGRAVYHRRELTYSVTAPAAWAPLREAYLRINRALAAGLRHLGVPAAVAAKKAGGTAPRPSSRACFRDPLPGEVTALGLKLVGSAQWRNESALLQHGSILMYNDQELVERLRVGGSRARTPLPATSLANLVDRVPSSDDLVQALAGGFEEELGIPAHVASTSPAELSLAEELLGRYETDSWTWRR